MTPTPHPRLEAREVEMSRPIHWLALAWRDMERCPTPGVIHGLILAITGGALFWYARHDFWWIAAMLSVCMMLAPLLATGLYEISRMLERDEEQPKIKRILAQPKNHHGPRLRARQAPVLAQELGDHHGKPARDQKAQRQ